MRLFQIRMVASCFLNVRFGSLAALQSQFSPMSALERKPDVPIWSIL
jgi:hypothetical protein